MCEQLRQTAMSLETTAQNAANTPNGIEKPDILDDLQTKLEDLKVAVKNYHEYLEEEDI